MKKHVNVRFVQEDRLDIGVTFSASEEDDEVKSLMESVADPLAGTLIVTGIDGSKVTLPENRIISISTSDRHLVIVSEIGQYEIKSSLQEMEEALNPRAFLRISRYEIINLNKVRKFDFSISGTLCIVMENDKEVWASRRFIPVIKGRLRGKE